MHDCYRAFSRVRETDRKLFGVNPGYLPAMTTPAHPAQRSSNELLTGPPPHDEPCASSGGYGDQGVDDLAAVGGVVGAPVVAEGRHDLQASAVVGGEVVGVLGRWLAQGIPDADSQPSVVGVQV